MFNTNLKFLRNTEAFNSRQEAMENLMLEYHEVGKPIIATYYIDDEKTSIDTIFGIGVKYGYGRDSFSVISTGQFVVVWDVVDELVDVSRLVNGQLYLYINEDNKGYYLYYTPTPGDEHALGERTIVEIGSDPKTFISLKTNNLWVSDDQQVVKSLNNIYSKDEVDKIIEELELLTDLTEIKSRLSTAEASIVDLSSRVDSIETSLLSVAKIKELHSSLTAELYKVNNTLRDYSWFVTGTDGIVFPSGSIEFKLSFTDYNNIITTHGFGSAIVYIDGSNYGSLVEKYDGTNYSYYIGSSISFSGTSKKTVKIVVTTLDNIEKTFEIFLYSIVGRKLYGRVNSLSDLPTLDHEVVYDYNYGKSGELLKTFDNLKIEKDLTRGYFVYAYPKSWGIYLK